MEPLQKTANGADDGSNKPRKILMLLFLGFLIAVLGIIILIIAIFIAGGGSTSFGIVIFIGPIPIIVGAGPEAQWLILFAIILTVLSVVMFTAMRKQTK
jgi:uncharacterized membrane protein